MRRHTVPLCAALLVVAACADQDRLTGPADGPDGPSLVISDGAHGPGRAGFYFLFPGSGSPGTGEFDATLAPTVRVVCLTDTGPGCPTPFASGTGSSAVKLDVSGESYSVVWKTPRTLALGPGLYREEVWVDPDGTGPLAPQRLGYADLHVVARAKDLATVNTAEYVGVVRGSPLQIRFRIDVGTVGVLSLRPSGTQVLGLGMLRTDSVTVLDLHGTPMAGVPVDWSVSPSDIATLSSSGGLTNSAGVRWTIVTGATAGLGAVTATVGGVSASIPLQVYDYNLVIGVANRVVPRSDACGNSIGEICESLVGNVVADAMRETYSTDFAITNSGGLRSSLTCPVVDIADYCPPITPPNYFITNGQAIAVHPFGNTVVTLPISGAELRSMLEQGVSTMPTPHGRFPQVSGLCFGYDISLPVGSRVLGAVRQATDGSCTGAAVDLTAAATYQIATNDFMAAGGDGYPDFSARVTRHNLMVQTLISWIGSKTPLSPLIQGRIACTTSGAVLCPTVVAAP